MTRCESRSFGNRKSLGWKCFLLRTRAAQLRAWKLQFQDSSVPVVDCGDESHRWSPFVDRSLEILNRHRDIVGALLATCNTYRAVASMTRNGYDEAGDYVGAMFAASGLVGSAITMLGLVLGLSSFRFGEGSERTLIWFFPVASLFADWVLHSAFLPMMFLQWVSDSVCGALALPGGGSACQSLSTYRPSGSRYGLHTSRPLVVTRPQSSAPQ